MITQTPEVIIEKARLLLQDSSRDIASKLEVSNDYVHEGKWLHLIIYPTVDDESALDYLDEIENIEMGLRKEFGPEIMIVPAKD